MIKIGKKVIACILSMLMVITSVPFIALADEPIDELKSAITAYETKMDGTVYTNMKDAYTAYYNAVKARDAYIHGARTDIDLAPITADLTTKTAAMQAFTPSFTTVVPSFHGDDLSAFAGTAYSNLLYSPQVDEATGTASNTNSKVDYQLFYAQTVLAFDGTTQLKMPIMVSAKMTGEKTRYLYGCFPMQAASDYNDHPDLALTGYWYTGVNSEGRAGSGLSDGSNSFAEQYEAGVQTFGYKSENAYASSQSTAHRSQQLPYNYSVMWIGFIGHLFYGANIMNVNTTFEEGQYIKSYTPTFYICASDEPNSANDSTTMRGSNTIYVINYKAYTDALANNAAKLATINKFNKTPDRAIEFLQAYDAATSFSFSSYDFDDSSKIVEAANRIQTLCETLASKNTALTVTSMSDYNKLFSAIDAYKEIYFAGNADGKYTSATWSTFTSNFERAVNAAGNVYEHGYVAEYDDKSIAYIAEALDFLLDKSGELGDNATYEFDSSTGVVTISGTGDLGDYTGTDSPFAGNTKITSVVIEDGVTTIGDYTFAGCTNLETVVIPSTVTHIGDGAFQDCSSLKDIVVPAGATYGDGAFDGCTSLETVEFGSGEIASKDDADHNAPWYQPSVKEIIITPGVTKIGEHAFSDATNIERLTVPCDIPVNTASNTNAFEGMTGLKYITITQGTTGEMINWGENNYYKRSPWYGNRNNAEMHVVVQSGVKNISNYAFYECSNIDDLSLPATIKSVGERAFYGCSALDDLYFFAPDCAIYDSSYTLRELIKIHGYDNSTAQAYANKYNREFILMGEHEHVYAAVVTAPTCEDDGFTTYTCNNCGDSYVADYVNALGHDWNDGVVTLPASCTTPGTKEFTCKRNHAHKRTDVIQATGHTWEKTSTTATCTTPGVTNYTCAKCDSKTTEITPALGHDYKRTVVAPDCSNLGYTEYECSRCHDSYQTDYKTTNENHDWDAGTRIKDPNCTEQGQILHTCNRNPQHTYIEYIPANGHTWDAGVVTAPTCVAQGYTTYTCTECGVTKKGNYTGVNPNNHKWDGGVVTAPTCTAQGYTTYTCTLCNETKVENYTNPTGHHYSQAVTAPTCTDGGYTTYTCSGCGDSYDNDHVDALGHDFSVLVKTVEPTCTAGGYTEYKCSRCDAKEQKEKTPAKGHSFTVKVVAPTCTDKGYTVKTCTVCKTVVKENYTNATGHSWNAGVVTKPATVEETGIKTYTCKNNPAHKKTEVIPKLTVAPVPSAAEATKAPVNTKIPKINAGNISTVSNLGKKTMTVKFNRVSGAQNYRVAFRKAGAKKWTYYWTGGKSTFVFKNLQKNQMYEFMFAAYRKNAKGKWERGNWSAVNYRYFVKGQVKKLTTKKNTITATWPKDKKAAYYEVFYSTNKNMSKNKKVKVAKSKNSVTIKKLKKGKYYYVRVRTIRKSGNKIYYGELSNVKKIKCK